MTMALAGLWLALAALSPPPPLQQPVAVAPEAPRVSVATLEPPAPLSSWRCADADDVRFASAAAAAQQATWHDVTVPERGPRTCGARVSWLVTTVAIAAAAAQQPVGIAIGVVEGPYQLYLDGQLMGGVGDVDTLQEAPMPGQAWAVPRAMLDDGLLTVALRIGQEPSALQAEPQRRLVRHGPVVIGRMPGVRDYVETTVSRAELMRLAPTATLAAIFFFVGLYHALVWLLRRDRRGYLWFAIFTLLVDAWITLVRLSGTSVLPWNTHTAIILNNFVGSLVSAAFIGFFHHFVERRPPGKRWRVYQLLFVAVALVGFVPVVGPAWTVSPPVILIKLAMPLVFFIACVHAAVKRKRREARVLLLAILLGVLFAPLEVIFEQRGIQSLIGPAEVAMLVFMLTMAVALAAQFARTLDEVDARAKELFETNASIARFVPFGFLQALDRGSVREVQRGDAQRRDMAVMFCDLRGFTSLAEGMSPDQTFRFLNDYLTRMEPEIYKGGGFINQYLGDGIMALFPTGAGGAVTAVMGMATALSRINVERAKKGEAPLKLGVGVHQGPLIIGTLGGGDQLDSGVVGDVVNAASRLEGMTKMYGAVALLSGAAVERIDGAASQRPTLRMLDTVRPKGKSEALQVFEILDICPHKAEKTATLQRFTDAQRAYRAGDFAGAGALFAACLEAAPHDDAARLLRDRCAELAAAPPVAWDGSYALLTK